MAELDDDNEGKVPNWINKNRMEKLTEKTNKNSPVNDDLNEFQKLAILTFLQTGNAHQAYRCLTANDDANRRDFKNSAVRTIKNLMEKPKSQDYINLVRTEIEQKTQVSKEELMQSCWEIMQLSKQNMDYGSSVKALALIAKVEGLLSKTVVDINKTVVIKFGGGFDPSQLPTIPFEEVKDEVNNEIIPEKFEIKPEHLRKIKDDNQGDNRIMNSNDN